MKDVASPRNVCICLDQLGYNLGPTTMLCARDPQMMLVQTILVVLGNERYFQDDTGYLIMGN